MPTSSHLLSVAMAVAAGLVGSFAVMRRMTLASDAISHIALPGIGVALAFRVHPAFGAIAALVAGALVIWGLEGRTRIATETLIGVVFSAALAVGSLLASGTELVDALLGSPGDVTPSELGVGLAGAAVVIGFVLVARHRLLIALVSADLARTAGVAVRRLDLLYLLAFALTVALGLRYLGVLLMGSLIIIPAATAKHLARSLTGMLRIAVGTAVLATVAGTGLAEHFHRPTGPPIVLAAAAIFALGLAAPRRA